MEEKVFVKMEGFAGIENYSISELQEVVKNIVRSDYTEERIELLVNIYTRAVISGPKADALAATCNSAIQLIRLGKRRLVSEEMHHLLCCVPDTYYDFVFGVENDIKNHPDKQKSMLTFLKKFEGVDTFAVISYASILNLQREASDEQIYREIKYCEETTLTEYDLEKVTHDLNIYEFKNHGWIMCKTFIKNKPYTVRLCKSICFVDYKNNAIGIGSIGPYGDDKGLLTVTAVLQDGEEELYPGVRDYLLNLMETIAKHKEWKEIIVHPESMKQTFYGEHGYQLVDAKDYRYDVERLWMKKM